MSRTCATALALVNWKGVFYERYLLDRHVTALEGANGAGKTTVMIAAYVVLLPDLARLRFTNLGETAATGGDRGIWGRLGDLGRPSYAAMELSLPNGEHIVAGVHLERKTEPSLELTPFIISGLDLQGSLKEVFLRTSAEHDEVPELSEVRFAVARRGGNMQVFGTAKEYFAALFDRGVNPLRLSTEEERTKMHDMLRTSMTGGISRALTSELRAFLLKEETGLADTIVRMRANLDACRRTRTEVAEARVLEREITGVFDAGHAMFTAVVMATRSTAAEARAAADDAAANLARLSHDVVALEEETRAIDARRTSAVGRLAELRARIDVGTARRMRAIAAREIATRATVVEAEAVRTTQKADEARKTRDEATGRRSAATTLRDRARDAHERAARGLGDLQSGLDELHLRAHAHRVARTRLAEARELLAEPELAAEAIPETLARVRRELGELDVGRARAARDLALRETQRDDYVKANAALGRLRALLGETVSADATGESEHAAARTLLAKLAGLEAEAARAEALESDVARARQAAALAGDIRARAEAQGLDLRAAITPSDITASSVVERVLAELDAEARTLDRAFVAAGNEATEADRTAATRREEAEGLEGAVDGWSSIATLAARLSAYADSPAGVTTAEDVARIRGELGDHRDRLRTEIATQKAAIEQHERDAERFDASAGLPDALLSLRDHLSADLLAARFDATSTADARWIEAALGPLSSALVVADPGVAAEALAQLSSVPENVWLVAEDDVAKLAEEAASHARGSETVDVVVRENHALRVSRLPTYATLGRDARTERAKALRAEAQTATRAIDAARDEAARVDGLMRDADRLLGDAVKLEAGDPAPRAAAARQAENAARDAERAAKERARAASERLEAARTKIDALRGILPHAHLLDPPDPFTRAEELAAALERSRSAVRIVTEARTDRALLADTLDALRHAPPTSDELVASEASRVDLETRRDRIFSAISALEEVAARPEALGWGDIEATLAAKSEVGGALHEQHEAARAEATAAEEALRAAEAAWEEATRAWQTAEGERAAAEAHLGRVRTEVETAGGADALRESPEALELDIEKATAERDALEADDRKLATDGAIAKERRERMRQALSMATTERERAENEAKPLEATWTAFERASEAAGVLAPAIARAPTLPSGAPLAGSMHQAAARAQRDLLLDRLAKVRGGIEVEGQVRSALERGNESPLAHLEGWLATRSWAMRRLPTQFADVTDPAAALDKLRADLGTLEERISLHENQLRGTSEDVARSIDVQLRKTAARVRRLNRDLESIGFGSVAAIRVQVKRVERMELVLKALRGGEMQELLFQSNLPFEEALAEVFKRYGGGSKSGAGRLLDYREYIELAVEIQRAASKEWEPASPTRLSTGEAIGVGAALMMVVLTEWERDANLLRSDRSTGTLRFLFLDEANRLSPDNLAVLFDLCRVLDLQLLVAAPEVARAQGNTTYRLVRRVDESGREEVIVSGRRATKELRAEGEASETATDGAEGDLSDESDDASSSSDALVATDETTATDDATTAHATTAEDTAATEDTATEDTAGTPDDAPKSAPRPPQTEPAPVTPPVQTSLLAAFDAIQASSPAAPDAPDEPRPANIEVPDGADAPHEPETSST